jgi:TMEM175 potassium channel family protein
MHFLLNRFRRGELRLTRIEAFSDGVFAIIVTLLVLELKVPMLKEHANSPIICRKDCPKFVSWLISFIIVCKFWLNHHHILGLARHADYAMVWLNSLFLLGQSFIPFLTALAGEYPTNPLAVSFFGLVFALNTFLFLILHAYIVRRLIRPELAAIQDSRGIIKALVGPASYLVGAALAWVSVPVAFVVYALTPLFYITPPEGRRSHKV